MTSDFLLLGNLVATFFWGLSLFTAQPCAPLQVGTRARAWVKKRLGTPPAPAPPALWLVDRVAQALVVVLVLGQHVPSCCLLLANYLQAQNVWSPPGSNTSGFDEFVRSIHSNARGVRPVWLAAAASFRRALGPGGPGEEPAAGAGQLAAGAALRDPPR